MYDFINENENAVIFSEEIFLNEIQTLKPRLIISCNYSRKITSDIVDFLPNKILEIPAGNNKILYEMCDYSMREIQASNLKMLLEWRNSPRISSVMLTDHEITWEEHLRWFCKIQNDNVKKNFIFYFKDEPIGYGGYSEFDEKNKTCSPSGYIGETKKAPKDAGIFLWYMGLHYAFDKLGIVKCSTIIFADNKKALKLDKLCGYEIDKATAFFVTKGGKQRLLYNATLTKESFKNASQKKLDLLQLYDN